MFHEDERALAQGPPKRERQSHGGPRPSAPSEDSTKNCSGAGRGALTATVAASWHLSDMFLVLWTREPSEAVN